MEEQNAAIRIAVLESQIVGLKESIKLQAHEYERRLTELNHEHARNTEDKAKFVNVDLFYSKIDEIAKWRGDLDQWRSKITGMAMVIGGVAGLGGGVIAAILSKIIK